MAHSATGDCYHQNFGICHVFLVIACNLTINSYFKTSLCFSIYKNTENFISVFLPGNSISKNSVKSGVHGRLKFLHIKVALAMSFTSFQDFQLGNSCDSHVQIGAS